MMFCRDMDMEQTQLSVLDLLGLFFVLLLHIEELTAAVFL